MARKQELREILVSPAQDAGELLPLRMKATVPGAVAVLPSHALDLSDLHGVRSGLRAAGS